MAEEHKDHGGGEEHGDGGGHGGGGHGGGGHGGGHGGGEHEESGAPEWLISFADNVALLMGFFVILLAMNMEKPKAGGIGGENKNPNEEMVADMVLSIRSAFNNAVDPGSDNPAEAYLRKRIREREQVGETKTPGPDGKDKNNQAVRPSDYVRPAGYALFADGSSTMTSDGKDNMAKVAEQLRGTRWIVEVRGHVSAAEANHNKEQAMGLAYARSLAAARTLVIEGMRWDQLRVVACADNERATPLAHDDQEQRNNQRVEVVETKEVMPSDPYSQSSSAGE
jgi:flagellar motor protein MotB